jgi:hypothetical protein
MPIRCPSCEGTAQEEFIGDDIRCDECDEVFEWYEQADMSEEKKDPIPDLRWRKFPEERPERDGYYEVALPYGATSSSLSIVYWSSRHDQFRDGRCPLEVTHWRGGPLP